MGRARVWRLELCQIGMILHIHLDIFCFLKLYATQNLASYLIILELLFHYNRNRVWLNKYQNIWNFPKRSRVLTF